MLFGNFVEGSTYPKGTVKAVLLYSLFIPTSDYRSAPAHAARFWFHRPSVCETPSSGATSTLTVIFNPLPVTKRDRTLV